MGVRKFTDLSPVRIRNGHGSRGGAFLNPIGVHRVGGIRVRELSHFGGSVRLIFCNGNLLHNRLIVFLGFFCRVGVAVGGIRCIDDGRAGLFILRDGDVVAGVDGHGTSVFTLVICDIEGRASFAGFLSRCHRLLGRVGCIGTHLNSIDSGSITILVGDGYRAFAVFIVNHSVGIVLQTVVGIRKFTDLSPVGIRNGHGSRGGAFLDPIGIHRVGGIRVRELSHFGGSVRLIFCNGNLLHNRLIVFLGFFCRVGVAIGCIRCIDDCRDGLFILRDGDIVAGVDCHGTCIIPTVVRDIEGRTAFARILACCH